MKKTIFIALFLLTGLLTSQSSFAQSNNGPSLGQLTYGPCGHSTINIANKSYRGQNVSNRNYTCAYGYKVDFYGSTGVKTRLSHSDLHNAIFYGANFRYSYFIKSNVSYGNFYGADLKHACFTSAVLKHANFEGADLQKVDFSYANMTSSRLYGANLQHAKCVGADFRGANIEGTDFRNADLRNADFRGAKRSVHTKFDGANLQGARF